MQANGLNGRIALGLLVFLAGPTDFARAGSTQDRFYEAFYLEQTKGDWSGAAKLYEQVITDRRAPDEMRSRAKARLAACREELASSDFAKLMPPEALVYIELNRPGQHITKLLGKLGLIASPDQIVTEGSKRVAVSPALIKEVLGIRGAAVAITGIDPGTGKPTGVALLHPGNVDVIRGLIETGLPVGGTAVEPISGYATFDVEGKALVTLTSRMVIASNDRSLIEDVVARLSGKEKKSLATNTNITESIGDRKNSLVAFFVNAKSIMPMVKGMMASEGSTAQELAMANAILDLESLQSVTGRLDVTDDGLSLDFALRLDKGHRNLIYNFLRAPAINRETLKCVPHGAAAFLVGALNEAGSRYSSSGRSGVGDVPIVTALDFGREIFANITGLAVFALPPSGDSSAGGSPIPDVAAAISVNDPAKSEALWTTILGVAGIVTGTPAIEGTPTEIQGTDVRTYKLHEGVTIYFTTMGSDIVVASSLSAMTRTIEAKQKGKSVLSDDAFAASLSRLGEKSTKGVFVHAGRCAQIAKQFMSPRALADAQPFFDALGRTVGAFVVEHTDQVFRVSANISGIPNIGNLLAKQLTLDARQHRRRKKLTKAMRERRWDDALCEADSQLAAQPNSAKLLRSKFKILAVGKKDPDAARACAETLYGKIKDNANALNSFAWALLTEDQYEDAYNDVALRFSDRSNGLSDHKNWMYLDTLAWAKFKSGDPTAAVELEKKAMDCSNGRGKKQLEEALAKFEGVAKESMRKRSVPFTSS